MNIKRIRRIAIGVALLLVLIAVVVVFMPIPPHGRFSFPDIGSEGDAYWELADGKIDLVVLEEYGKKANETRQYRDYLCEYRKIGGHWVTTDGSDKFSELRATLLSLTIVESNGSQQGPFYRYEIYKGR